MPSNSRLDRVRASPQFNGTSFVNTLPAVPLPPESAVRPSLSDFLCGGERRIPGGALPLADPRESWASESSSGLRVTRMGHSSLVIEIDGARFLTDPVWGSRASPLSFAGPKRFHPPPVALNELPPLDAVIISHDHYDHLDRGTIRALAPTGVPFVTSLGVGAHLERWGVPAERITELDWWESTDVRGVRLTAAPAQHFSGRGLKDRNATLWSSVHLRGPTRSFFYGADSGLTTGYRTIAERLGPFDGVALEIGAFHPSWGTIHLGPDRALEARRMLGSGVLLPIHWATFNLAMHPWDEPAEVVARQAPVMGIPLLMPRIGQPCEWDRAPVVDAWWRTVAQAPSKRPRRAASGSGAVEWQPD